MIKSNGIIYYFAFTICMLAFQFSFSQEKTDSILFTADFFDKNEPLDITLEFNIKNLKRNKYKGSYDPAIIKYKDANGYERNKAVRLKARGKFRKKYCFMPPFWLNVNKTEVSRVHLANAKKIKIVSNCHNSKTYDEFVLKEYLVYKIFNLLTNYSFRVRLVNLKLIDTDRKNKESTNLVFMIEPEELLAERLNSLPVKIDNLSFYHTDSLIIDKMSFFQYLIGNTDFAITKRHNVKLFISKDFTRPKPFPVPYDFDYSGFVNTLYALPDEFFNISDVKERFYRGMCRSDNTYTQLISYFLEKENEIKSLIMNFEHLDEKARKEALNYIESFYKDINDPEFIEKIRKTCKKNKD
ncbi:MAG: hypothetical protein KOO66_13790 [Bacteroidales bacterium]|nr:hypothetical protein [Bacteroidales bacterium]